VSRKYPDILGYYGDVLFPSQVLGRVIDLVDADLLFDASDTHQTRQSRISSVLKTSFEGYPRDQVATKTFAIIYCTREYEGMASKFHISVMNWSLTSDWTEQWLDIPKESDIIGAFGSGEQIVSKWHARWSRTKEARTSRSVFSAFCDALNSGEDAFSGGAPQLVGIYRKGLGETFGIISKSERFVFGLPVAESEKLGMIEWRNSLFERCDWRTKEPLPEAQRHARPRGLGNA